MPDPRQILPNGGRAPGQRQVVYGKVSTRQPAPSSFTDPLFVVLPFNPDNAIRVDNWPACHGATLPALNADALLIFDDEHTLRVAWWDGEYTEPSGLASGVATLVAGAVSIVNTAITSSSRVRLTNVGAGGTLGVLSVALSAGVGFAIHSTSGADTSRVFWEVVRY